MVDLTLWLPTLAWGAIIMWVPLWGRFYEEDGPTE